MDEDDGWDDGWLYYEYMISLDDGWDDGSINCDVFMFAIAIWYS